MVALSRPRVARTAAHSRCQRSTDDRVGAGNRADDAMSIGPEGMSNKYKAADGMDGMVGMEGTDAAKMLSAPLKNCPRRSCCVSGSAIVSGTGCNCRMAR